MNEESNPQPQGTNQQQTPGWQYKPEEPPAPSPGQYADPSTGVPHEAAGSSSAEVTWTASEFIAHHRSFGWYAAVIGTALALAVGLFLLTDDRISSGAIVIVAILLCIAAARKPRVLTYTVDNDGLSIGKRFYPFNEFRSFSAVLDGPFINIELVPTKRFMPMTSIYCSPEDEDAILETLSQHVPYEERGHALVDLIARNLRF
jgi:hypothetical protein